MASTVFPAPSSAKVQKKEDKLNKEMGNAPTGGLTGMTLEVQQLLNKGLQQKEIAKLLGVSAARVCQLNLKIKQILSKNAENSKENGQN
jgi:DNA-binding NarL/FixJ family response regulator